MDRRASHSGAAQLERTALSWHRSALAVAANGALVAREGYLHNAAPVVIIGFGIVGVSGVLLLTSTGRYRGALEYRSSNLTAGDRRVVRLWLLFVVLLSVVDLVVAVLP